METHKKTTCITKDPRETNMHHRRLMCHETPTCITGDPWATDICLWRPMRDRHLSSETHERPTCFFRDPWETDLYHRRLMSERPTHIIGNPWNTDILHRRPMRDRNASLEIEFRFFTCFIWNIVPPLVYVKASRIMRGLRWWNMFIHCDIVINLYVFYLLSYSRILIYLTLKLII